MKIIDIIVKLLILYVLVLIFYGILSIVAFYRHINDIENCYAEWTLIGKSEGLVCED